MDPRPCKSLTEHKNNDLLWWALWEYWPEEKPVCLLDILKEITFKKYITEFQDISIIILYFTILFWVIYR